MPVQTSYLSLLTQNLSILAHRMSLLGVVSLVVHFVLFVGRVLHEISLNESIRYNEGDPVEAWLNQLLCLDATQISRITSGCPSPQSCDLYYVNRYVELADTHCIYTCEKL